MATLISGQLCIILPYRTVFCKLRNSARIKIRNLKRYNRPSRSVVRLFHSNRTVLANTHYSISYTELVEHIDNEFEMLDYKKRQKEIMFPALQTSEQKLIECTCIGQVLDVMKNTINTLPLETIDITVFWKYLSEKVMLEKYENNSLQNSYFNILDNVHVQKLIIITIQNMQHLLTSEISNILLCLRNIEVPCDSYIFCYVVNVLKKRINEFFPKDVVIVYDAINGLKPLQPHLKSFEEGLLLHLENLLVDEKFIFMVSAEGLNLQLKLLNIQFVIENGSSELKDLLLHATEKTSNKQERLQSKEECLLALKLFSNYKLEEIPLNLLQMTMTFLKRNREFFNKNELEFAGQSLKKIGILS